MRSILKIVLRYEGGWQNPDGGSTLSWWQLFSQYHLGARIVDKSIGRFAFSVFDFQFLSFRAAVTWHVAKMNSHLVELCVVLQGVGGLKGMAMEDEDSDWAQRGARRDSNNGATTEEMIFWRCRWGEASGRGIAREREVEASDHGWAFHEFESK